MGKEQKVEKVCHLKKIKSALGARCPRDKNKFPLFWKIRKFSENFAKISHVFPTGFEQDLNIIVLPRLGAFEKNFTKTLKKKELALVITLLLKML